MASYQSTAAGGRVNLRLPSASPKWLGACERGLLSELRYDDHDIARLGEDQYIVGANMCIDRDAFTSVGLFDIHFDRTATTLRSSGELEYTRRLQASGRIVSFVAEACVFHQIDPIRLTKRYFYSRSYWQGRSDALLESKWPRPAILGDRDLKVAALELVRYIYALVPERRADARFQYRLALAREFGYILQEMILQFREPTRVSFVS
jgi:GT2 family glycosyltransferase